MRRRFRITVPNATFPRPGRPLEKLSEAYRAYAAHPDTELLITHATNGHGATWEGSYGPEARALAFRLERRLVLAAGGKISHYL